MNETISLSYEVLEYAVTVNGDDYGLNGMTIIFFDEDPRISISNQPRTVEKRTDTDDVIIIDPRTMIIEGKVKDHLKPMIPKIMEFIEKNKDLLLYHSENPDISMTEFFNSITKV